MADIEEAMRKGFCRALLINPIFADVEVRNWMEAAGSRKFSDLEVQQLILESRKSLESACLDIVQRLDEENGQKYYVLVNNATGRHLRSNPAFPQQDYELFKKILEQIITSGAGFTTDTNALNATSSMVKKMTKGDAQKVLVKFVREGWLKKDREGRVSLTPRAVAEFKRLLQSSFDGHVADCILCQDLVVKGRNCAKCDAKCHRPCLRKYYERRKQAECPSCKEPDLEVQTQSQDEQSTSDDIAESQSVASQATNGRGRKKTKRVIDSDEDDD